MTKNSLEHFLFERIGNIALAHSIVSDMEYLPKETVKHFVNRWVEANRHSYNIDTHVSHFEVTEEFAKNAKFDFDEMAFRKVASDMVRNLPLDKLQELFNIGRENDSERKTILYTSMIKV